jgi:hypothetical protein
MIFFIDHPQFSPDLIPAAILLLGAFGGTYFRPIYSSINKQNYECVYKKYKQIKNMDLKYFNNSEYDVKLNCFQTVCGTSLEYWESKKWIKSIDPYGWFQWYCEFYEGRRSVDDIRQIKRWLNRKRIYTKTKKTLVIRQVWLHWAIL